MLGKDDVPDTFPGRQVSLKLSLHMRHRSSPWPTLSSGSKYRISAPVESSLYFGDTDTVA